jgi:hypothetical protein
MYAWPRPLSQASTLHRKTRTSARGGRHEHHHSKGSRRKPGSHDCRIERACTAGAYTTERDSTARKGVLCRAGGERVPVTDQATGLPYNLVETPVEYITVTSRLSPDFNQRQHPFCGYARIANWRRTRLRCGQLEIKYPSTSESLSDSANFSQIDRDALSCGATSAINDPALPPGRGRNDS